MKCLSLHAEKISVRYVGHVEFQWMNNQTSKLQSFNDQPTIKIVYNHFYGIDLYWCDRGDYLRNYGKPYHVEFKRDNNSQISYLEFEYLSDIISEELIHPDYLDLWRELKDVE